MEQASVSLIVRFSFDWWSVNSLAGTITTSFTNVTLLKPPFRPWGHFADDRAKFRHVHTYTHTHTHKETITDR